jgi:hypothetical protein
MSSPNFINNALTQLFDDIEQKCRIKFNTFTANDRPQNRGINSDQEYMKMYQETEDNRTYKYLYDPDLNFDFRFHQRMARINYGKRKEPWCSLMFNTNYVKPVSNITSHVYTGIEYAEFPDKDKITGKDITTTEGVEYQFRRVVVPVNFVLLSNELAYLYHIMENLAMYFDRWIDFTYRQTLKFSPLTEVHWDLVGQAQNIRQINLEKLDTESKGSLAMIAYSFELTYWDIWTSDTRYKLLERIILEVREAVAGQLIFIDICD